MKIDEAFQRSSASLIAFPRCGKKGARALRAGRKKKSTHALRTSAQTGGIARPEPGGRADRRAAISSHDRSNAAAFTPMGFFVTLNWE